MTHFEFLKAARDSLAKITEEVNAGRKPKEVVEEPIVIEFKIEPWEEFSQKPKALDDLKEAIKGIVKEAKEKRLIIFDSKIIESNGSDNIVIVLFGYRSHGGDNAKGGKLQEMLEARKGPMLNCEGRSHLR
jgi:hypothetical protein